MLQTARYSGRIYSCLAEIALSSFRSIAIIDDSASVRRSVESLLRSLGFEVWSFASAEDFLASDARGVSCVVTDVEMPGLTGIDLYETMRAARDDTPIIFITAASEQQVRSRLGSEPCVLGKPFEAMDLASCIEQAMAA
jgi:FixJ family two-component response regulator